MEKIEEIIAYLKEIAADCLSISDSTVIEDNDCLSDFRGDSLDKVEILVRIEDDYGITFSDQEMQDFLYTMKIEEIAGLIRDKIARKQKSQEYCG